MVDLFSSLRENLGEGLRAAEPLSRYTNFKIGGRAKYFFTAHSSESLIRALQVAEELKLPHIVLGGGSNVIVSDSGFNGLVIVVKSHKISRDGSLVTAEAGVSLGFLVQTTVAFGLSGLEPLVAVPGTIGGAIYGNAGVPQVARGVIGDWVKEVVACRGDTLIHMSQAECKFAYRDSVFKHNHDVIVSVSLELELGETDRSRQLIKRYIDARKGQPYHMPSSGCIFTNVSITDPQATKVKFASEEKLPEFLTRGQLPASWLIDRAGLKGKTIGKIQVSTDHANYLVNLGGGRAEEVVQMISYIKQQVRDRFGIELQEEVRYLGF